MGLIHADGFTFGLGPYLNFGNTTVASGLGRDNGVNTVGILTQSFAGRAGPTFVLPAALTTVITGFATYCNDASGVSRLAAFWNGSTTHVYLNVDAATGLVSAYNGSNVLLGTSTAPIWAAPGEWAYVECKVTISDTVGAVEVRLYGTTILSLTNVDTRNGATTNMDRVSIG